jgi:putative flippase GtrA
VLAKRSSSIVTVLAIFAIAGGLATGISFLVIVVHPLSNSMTVADYSSCVAALLRRLITRTLRTFIAPTVSLRR